MSDWINYHYARLLETRATYDPAGFWNMIDDWKARLPAGLHFHFMDPDFTCGECPCRYGVKNDAGEVVFAWNVESEFAAKLGALGERGYARGRK